MKAYKKKEKKKKNTLNRRRVEREKKKKEGNEWIFGVEEGFCGIWKMGRVLKGIEMRRFTFAGL